HRPCGSHTGEPSSLAATPAPRADARSRASRSRGRERRSRGGAPRRRTVRVQRRAATQRRAVARRVGTDARPGLSFPIVLSNGPPPNGKAPNGRNGLAEVAAAGVTHIRTGRGDWSAAQLASQIAAERAALDALQARGLQGWSWLGDLPNVPEGATSPQSQLLARVADGLGGHAALGFY